MADPEIANGIEYTHCEGEYDVNCARCGGGVEWLNCANCGGEGVSHHDCGEDCCACLYPEDNVRCDWCRGSGGSWHCTNTPAWCEANPLPGRESVESTALRPEAWMD